MAGGADFQVDVAFMGRAGLKSAPAGAIDVHELIGGMDFGFHRIGPNGKLIFSLACGCGLVCGGRGRHMRSQLMAWNNDELTSELLSRVDEAALDASQTL